MNAPSRAVSTWAPLRNEVFRALWFAVLVSNVCGVDADGEDAQALSDTPDETSHVIAVDLRDDD